MADASALDRTRDRVRGALLGLAAGDRNGGPIRMVRNQNIVCDDFWAKSRYVLEDLMTLTQALRLAQSLIAKQKYDRNDIIDRYYKWFRGPPYDTERAFDTGATFASVFHQYAKGVDIDTASRKTLGMLGPHIEFWPNENYCREDRKRRDQRSPQVGSFGLPRFPQGQPVNSCN